MFWGSKAEVEKLAENQTTYTYNSFQPGEEFPPIADRERISKYKRLKKIVSRKTIRSLRKGVGHS